ncbi:hypothetical protein CQW23_01628 [Capsicum baccatum]|uniref:DOG1 domain-containing protein n=1 Tax=Capsicum baccatum TaxID=33114 RepID=A0A2G2XP47_CAPBA|nr:hypothetical protein CQW23_01628 [Capsicum baccatum]
MLYNLLNFYPNMCPPQPHIKGHVLGSLAFDVVYAQWLEEHNQRVNELRGAVSSHADDGELQIIVDGILADYDDLFRIKGFAATANVFHILSEEIVKGYEVLSVPPNLLERMSEKEFCLHDLVDVFANDGCWFGVICGKIVQEYYVYFSTTADNIAYLPDVFRFHHEWSNGKWVLH